MPIALLLAVLLLLPGPLPGQGLPAFAPISPVASARSGLAFEPYREPAPGRWTVALGLDYGTTIEYNDLNLADYLLDSELMRLGIGVRRDVSGDGFLLADVELRGAYDGFLDGFLDWYHGLLGIEIPERERRPKNEFLFSVAPPGREPVERGRSDLFLGDLRLGAGIRWNPSLQSVLAVTLPTATGPDGYGRSVVSVNLLNTLRAGISRRLVYEGSLSAGYTERHGPLADLQHRVMVAASSGLRMALWGRHAIYGNLFYHSPYYERTTLPSLDGRELSFDFGWVLGSAGGTEWRIGMTEDLEPRGPAIDLIFRLGASF